MALSQSSAKANRNFCCLSVRKGFLTSANLLRPAFRSDHRTFSENIFSCQCDCGIFLLHLGLVFIASYTPYELLDVAKNPLQVCIIFYRQNENFWRIFSLGQQRFQLPLKSANMLHLMEHLLNFLANVVSYQPRITSALMMNFEFICKSYLYTYVI